MLERGHRGLEDALAQLGCAGHGALRPKPGAVANVRGDHVGVGSDQTLGVDDVELRPAAEAHAACAQETQHGGQRVGPDGRNVVEANALGVVGVEPVGEDVNVVAGAKPLGQLHDVAAMPEVAVVLVDHECDSHRRLERA